MKKTISFILIILATLCKVQAQKAFADSTATWNVYFGTNPDTTKVIKVDSTFLFAGKFYQNIGGFIYSQDSFSRVYSGLPGNEHLLYDFGKNLGDTILGLGEPSVQYYALVDSIDSIFIGYNRKRMFVSCSPYGYMPDPHGYNDIWIEGIGSQFDRFLAPYFYSGPANYDPFPINLLCYYEHNQLLYLNTYYDTCFYHRGDKCDLSASFTLIQNADSAQNWTLQTNITTSHLPISYTWNWGDGRSSNGASATHTYHGPGNYNICLKLQDGLLCETTYCDSTTYITNSDQLNIQLNCIPASPTNINQQIKEAKTFLYPNPATNRLTVTTNGLPVSEMRIYNANGQLLLEVKQPQNNTIDISNLSNGIYIAEIKTKAGSAMRRWVKM